MCFNGFYNMRIRRESNQIIKISRSADRSLKLNCVKSESIVIADHHAAVNP